MNDRATQSAAPGWYPDPEQAQTQRYWDGHAWTEQRAPLPGAAPEATASPGELPPAGWYPDPEQAQTQRYWTGSEWTTQRAPLWAKSGGLEREYIFAVGAAIGMVIGAIGPWINTVLIDVGGLDGDGVIVLFAGLVGLCAVGLTPSTKAYGAAAVLLLLCGLAGAGTAIYDLTQIYGSETELFGENIRVANPGWGIWLSAVASVALGVSALAIMSLSRRRAG